MNIGRQITQPPPVIELELGKIGYCFENKFAAGVKVHGQNAFTYHRDTPEAALAAAVRHILKAGVEATCLKYQAQNSSPSKSHPT